MQTIRRREPAAVLGRLSGRTLLAVTILALTLLAVAGCSGGTSSGAGEARPGGTGADRLVVATTVAPLTSIVAAVAGDRAEVRGIVPEGTNSHTFEPPPSTAATLAGADLVFLNGLQLEEPTRKLAEADVRPGTPVVALGERTLEPGRWLYDFSFPREEGKPNPHLWTDPPLARRYGEIVLETLVAADAEGAEDYRRNFDAWAARLDELDRAMRTALATVPPANRKLLTYHDAYAYFARDYGWTVIGAIQVADFEEPSAREVAELIEQVRTEQVPAIFGSEVFPSPVLEQIGRETGVRYVDTLRDDDLPGAPGEPQHSLIGLLRGNYVTMTEALGGDATALHAFDVGPSLDGAAEYPQ